MKKLRKKISKNYTDIVITEVMGALRLQGIVETWEDYMKLGYMAAQRPYRGVINDLQVNQLIKKGVEWNTSLVPEEIQTELDGKVVDVLIIGGGVIGSAIGYYLSKWDLSVLLVEKESDLAMHQSSRNDGMVHPGIVPRPGSQKAKYNARGNLLYEQLTKDLGVPFIRRGTLSLFDRRWMKIIGKSLLKRAEKNGVPGVRIVDKKELMKMEPNLTEDIMWGIHMPTTGVCPPYKMTIALAEAAIQNGVEIALETMVYGINMDRNKIVGVKTNKGTLKPKIVINAAGLFSDKIAKMAGDQFFTIHPRKGEVILLDRGRAGTINHVLTKFRVESLYSKTKGGGLVPTVEGNILIGPNAYEQPCREEYSTKRENVDQILGKNLAYINGLSQKDVITYLGGTRAATFKEDFIVEKSEYVDNLIHSAGIQSPGFASAPAIAEEIERLTITQLRKEMKVLKKTDFNPRRKGIPKTRQLSDKELQKLIEKKPEYGEIICRCEEISKGEILEALRSPLPVSSVDGIKRRTRAGMGRCQGGFCTPFIAKIIAEEKELELSDILKKGQKSHLLVEKMFKGEKVDDL